MLMMINRLGSRLQLETVDDTPLCHMQPVNPTHLYEAQARFGNSGTRCGSDEPEKDPLMAQRPVQDAPARADKRNS